MPAWGTRRGSSTGTKDGRILSISSNLTYSETAGALPQQGETEAEADTARRSVSQSIAIARVICICGIVYVHAWTGLNIDQLRAQGTTWQSVLYWVLIELFGRSSVPLLSIISGWLVMASVSRRGYAQFTGGKAKTLLLPMILWNAITVGLVVFFATYGDLRAPKPGLGLPILNEIFHLTAPGEINVQNAFLRDMFVCMLAAPLLVRLPNALLAAVLAATLCWSIEGWQLYVLLRPQILLFFLIGIFAYRHRLDRFADRVPVLPLVLAFLAMGVGKCWFSIMGQHYQLSHPQIVATGDNLLRLVAALIFWKLAMFLARRPLGAAIGRYEPYTFLLFCTHVMFMWLLAPVIGPLFGRFGEPGYPLFLIMLPFLALGGAIGIGKGLQYVSPVIARLLSGRRLQPAHA